MIRITTPTRTRGLAPSHSPPDVRYAPGIAIARGLGCFSIVLGVVQIVAPDALARLIGVRTRPRLFRLLGVREIACGLGILAVGRPAGWLAARVAGDAIDLLLLGRALRSRRSDRARVAAAAVAVVGVAALDAASSASLGSAAAMEG